MLRELEALCSPYYSLTDKYSLGKTLLGAGAGGTVMLATNKSTKEKVALKTIDLKKQHRPDLIVMEIKVKSQQPSLIREWEQRKQAQPMSACNARHALFWPLIMRGRS